MSRTATDRIGLHMRYLATATGRRPTLRKAASAAVLLASVLVTGGSATAADEPGRRPEVPVVIHADDLDPCSNGVVVGLNPAGDGFLAVKSGPGLNYARIDKLYNGEEVYVCGSRGDWLAVVYSRRGGNCNVNRPWTRTLPYTGPCKSGWSHRRWIDVYAG